MLRRSLGTLPIDRLDTEPIRTSISLEQGIPQRLCPVCDIRYPLLPGRCSGLVHLDFSYHVRGTSRDSDRRRPEWLLFWAPRLLWSWLLMAGRYIPRCQRYYPLASARGRLAFSAHLSYKHARRSISAMRPWHSAVQHYRGRGGA